MTILRRGRFLYWLARELFDKYTKALTFGVVVGTVAMFFVWKFSPYIKSLWFSPVIRIGIVGEFTPSSLPLSIQKNISLGLTTIASDGNVLPGLATSWESTDSGKSYIFTLKNNFLWHNGDTVKAGDVNYNIRDVTFVADGDFTLRATLKDPYSPFPTLVAKPILQRGLNGFGAYRVANLKLKGDIVQYIRLTPIQNEVDKILEYRFFRTEAQAIMAYKLGDIDTISDLSSPAELAGWENTNVEKTTRYDQVVSLYFNSTDKLLGEKSVRQALGYALPEVSEERAYSPLSKSSWAYTDKIRRYDANIAQSKKILSGASIDLTDKEITITTFSQYVTVAQAIVEKWSELGVKAKVRVVSVLSPDFQIFLRAQAIPPDPDQYPFWHSTQHETNITAYTNVKIDKILEDGRKESDIEKRKKLYSDFQRFLVEDSPAIFFYYPVNYSITRI